VISTLDLSAQSGIDCRRDTLGDGDENTTCASGMSARCFSTSGSRRWRRIQRRGKPHRPWRWAAQSLYPHAECPTWAVLGLCFLSSRSSSRGKYRLTTYKQCWRSCASEWSLDYHLVLKLCFATLLVNLITDKKKYLNCYNSPRILFEV
jgi:hypothetical protein